GGEANEDEDQGAAHPPMESRTRAHSSSAAGFRVSPKSQHPSASSAAIPMLIALPTDGPDFSPTLLAAQEWSSRGVSVAQAGYSLRGRGHRRRHHRIA